MLIATVVLSFAAALGGSLVLFDLFADFPGEDPSYPLFAFIFLVALGVDYNIFLMARVREEALLRPTQRGDAPGRSRSPVASSPPPGSSSPARSPSSPCCRSSR